MNKTKTMMTNKLSTIPTIPVIMLIVLNIRFIKSSDCSDDGDVVTSFVTSLVNDEFSITAVSHQP